MATVIYDTIEGASLVTGGGQPPSPTERIRTGRIKGISVVGSTTTPDPHVLEKALALLPPIGDPYPTPPGGSGAVEILGLRLASHALRPWSHNQIVFALRYRTDLYNGTLLSSLLVTDSSRLIKEQTNMIPGTRVPVKVAWQSQTDPNDFIPEDLLTYQYEKTLRVIRLAQIIYSEPASVQREAVGLVNNAAYYGYPKGYWRVEAYETVRNMQTGQRQVTAEISSKIDEDWSTYGVLRNIHTGKNVIVDPSVTAALVATDYIYGVTTILVSGKDTGVAKIGPYKVGNFTTIFGTIPV